MPSDKAFRWICSLNFFWLQLWQEKCQSPFVHFLGKIYSQKSQSLSRTLNLHLSGQDFEATFSALSSLDSWSITYVNVLSNQYICLFREVNKKLNKKKRDQSKLKAEDQQNYVDSSRSIAVSLDSKELSRALKHFSKDFVWTHKLVLLLT